MILLFYLSKSLVPEGAPPSTWEQYAANIDEQSGQFTCFDGKKKIKISQINDNFRDCLDGSDEPGTSASNEGTYYCSNNGFIPYPIAKWSVGDGICDCCDGADEKDNPRVQCPNTCARKEHERSEAARDYIDSLNYGYKRRFEMESQGKKIYRAEMEKIEKYKNEIQELNESINRLQNEINSTEVYESQTIEYSPFRDFISNIYDFTFGWHDYFSPSSSSASEKLLKKQKDRLKDLSAKYDEIANFSSVNSESIPLFSLYEHEYRHDRFIVKLLKNIKDRSNTIGIFKSYNPSTRTLTYDDGDFCFVVNNSRKANIKMECWKTTKLISSSEPRTCEYELVLATPLVCETNSSDIFKNMTIDQINEYGTRFDQ
ncbi:hypothetical protein TVAG_475210 [Trichomonas vaginalis G3]|uniref:Glucosidase 2 subunit beta n=1 Tax=Trichomonas vaginalis (strain ATCC PRA-98 / G3) TaxID=412133 RepID=A2EM28_TRIV3|nr:N-glycan processing [Trichomonas vaginalis G3]EAY06287.1 hypothetical protein TVAG_475210 [Trichomonas vaginalis G3]KAI5503365.1 N-glycan processing [Trichomonas vaginalis G3]|eukprot:XP_001318510.1 hypothetical protein [Trichomonas vaginalis G3]